MGESRGERKEVVSSLKGFIGTERLNQETKCLL
jgi:hypothetical protein